MAYAWGVNGLASVVASVLGVALAMNLGYAVASLVAGACYAFALVHAAAGRWTAAEPPAPEEPDTTGPDEASEVTEPIPA